MSLSAAVIDALVATGATAEQLAAAIKASLAEQEAKLTEKRQKDAARQRKSRASRNVTVTPCDSADAPPSLDKETPPTPPKEINPIPREGGSALPRKAGGFSAPEGVDPETWAAFCQQRKKPITRLAFDRISKTLREGADSGWPPGELFERAIERGYETVFIPNEKRNGHRPANDRSEPTNPMVAAGLRIEARFADRERAAREASGNHGWGSG